MHFLKNDFIFSSLYFSDSIFLKIIANESKNLKTTDLINTGSLRNGTLTSRRFYRTGFFLFSRIKIIFRIRYVSLTSAYRPETRNFRGTTSVCGSSCLLPQVENMPGGIKVFSFQMITKYSFQYCKLASKNI